jgi:hypothetical protein
MAALDANNDRELSADELADALAALKKLDEGGDGKLSREELRPPFGGRGSPSPAQNKGGVQRRRTACFLSPPSS